MKTIETNATVTKDQMLIVPLPMKMAPGEVRVVVVIEEAAPPVRRPHVTLRAYDVGLVSPHVTFRREDLYGDDQSRLS